MAAATIMYDDLTGVTLVLSGDTTTSELMTVAINGHEILIPEEAHSELYTVAEKLQDMMRAIKSVYLERYMGTGKTLVHTQAHVEFNDAVFRFVDGIEKFG